MSTTFPDASAPDERPMPGACAEPRTPPPGPAPAEQLVPFVPAVVGEAVAVLVTSAVVSGVLLGLAGAPERAFGFRVTALVVVAVPALVAVAALLERPRRRAAAERALRVPDPRAEPDGVRAVRRNLARGYRRNACYALLPPLALWHTLGPGAGLILPLVHVSGLVTAVATARWERAQGLVLWRSAPRPGRPQALRDPFRATTARPRT
ncbi:hypothetical protein ACWERV_06910 [Streptomyces sp. NPDC004031]